MRSGEGMSAGELLKQANQLKRSGRLDEAIGATHTLRDRTSENRSVDVCQVSSVW
ncbi:MAG: hypothetical protein KFF72_20330 [Arthrospira sp. SH-MAG29]|nr:hypothetical protein [Arthrospira sp. SH-MAG29]MBS0018664.1 hypothetical protein [Arthrospira sp. SH-MAG29]